MRRIPVPPLRRTTRSTSRDVWEASEPFVSSQKTVQPPGAPSLLPVVASMKTMAPRPIGLAGAAGFPLFSCVSRSTNLSGPVEAPKIAFTASVWVWIPEFCVLNAPSQSEVVCFRFLIVTSQSENQLPELVAPLKDWSRPLLQQRSVSTAKSACADPAKAIAAHTPPTGRD